MKGASSGKVGGMFFEIRVVFFAGFLEKNSPEQVKERKMFVPRGQKFFIFIFLFYK